MAARGGVDLMLTRNDDETYDRMIERRKGTIGPNCDRDKEYKGPGTEKIKSSVSRCLDLNHAFVCCL